MVVHKPQHIFGKNRCRKELPKVRMRGTENGGSRANGDWRYRVQLPVEGVFGYFFSAFKNTQKMMGNFCLTPRGLWVLFSLKAVFFCFKPLNSWNSWVPFSICNLDGRFLGSNPYAKLCSVKIGILLSRLTSSLACCISNWRSRTPWVTHHCNQMGWHGQGGKTLKTLISW